MRRVIFDSTLLGVLALFVYQATETKPESYDVMGPALWPMVVSLFTVVLVLLVLVTGRRQSADPRALTARFYFFSASVLGCVVVLSWSVVPFFIPTAILCLVSFLLLRQEFTVVSTAIAAASALAFCFALQWVFTAVVHLDLPTRF